ncbi:sigma-54-dependent Fis family transcriptional regulator [Lewinellaceae bacterium SD302]|nr:sigma-54-dependent Fis family transcriptional regulator [Lewinellaceae bacterium SD302]
MVCKSLELLFRRKQYAVTSVHTPGDAFQRLAAEHPDLILLDMNFTIETSGKQGLKTLRRIVDDHPGVPVILMTGWATVQLAVEGMKIGARDFLAKPWDNQHLLASVQTILSLDSPQPTPVSKTNDPFASIIGQSPQLTSALATARRVAPTDASVLITGESGTGKELVAEAIHHASKRAAAPFVAVNLGGVPESLFESELFGHKAGAFTDARSDRKGRFELAEGGSLLLDEIGDLPLSNQVKLLRVLQERHYARLGESRERKMDIRLISATSRPLHQLVSNGRFREDLLFRINLIHLHLPPLRDRRGDISFLARHFLSAASRLYERPDLTFNSEALVWLEGRPFPGNIRELRNLVERVAILTDRAEIGPQILQRLGHEQHQSKTTQGTEGKTLLEVEERMVRRALTRHSNNITEAAKELGLTRAALYRRLEKFGIRHDD